MRIVTALLCIAGAASAQTTISQKTAGMKALPGFLPLHYEEKAGKLWMEVSRWNADLLYYPSLPAGVGSNDIGLDRGQLGLERLVRFERHGGRVLLVQPNTRFVATSQNPREQASVRDSFAQSVLWGFEVAAEETGRVLVDATPFFLRDAHGVSEAMKRNNQGTFRLEATRSALYEPRTRNFPRNTEVEAILTFVGENPGPWVGSVAPSAESVTVRQHHSFVELPDSQYKPRVFDPRSGFMPGAQFMDFSTPIGEPIVKRYAARHRLTREKPIVYYLDPGTPEPVRSALLEGARWWSEAFAAAGFPNGFRVEMLPDDADPMDIRYNVIQWVHRSTRGWSYGSGVTDPRTGEILKGHVTLGSLRVRQDYMIAEGLLAPHQQGQPLSLEMDRMALARLRQLSAHEVGHTLGITHNFAASVSDRASVMDYPHPLAMLSGTGAPTLLKAYATGIGEWDKIAIRWGYGNDDAALTESMKRGFRFISDADARAAGGAHPHAHLWDNAANAEEELERIMQVRSRALDRFGENAIRPGAPMSSLADVLVPVYLAHRYQVEAAVKILGGLDYNYALRGDGQLVTRIVPAAEQKRALDALLRTVSAEALTLPEPLLKILPPPAYGFERTRESFGSRTGLTFDPLAAAESAASLTLGLILHPERAARVVQHHARDNSMPSLDLVLDAVLTATWNAQRQTGLAGEVQKTIDGVLVYHLMALAARHDAPTAVRASVLAKMAHMTGRDQNQQFLIELVERFRKDPKQPLVPTPMNAPPGQPI